MRTQDLQPWQRRRPRHLAWAMAAMLTAACSGESDPEGESGTPLRVAERQALEASDTLRRRARALASAAVAPAEAARQLMDFAESQFPQFFPSHQATQSLSPFLFRHYPETGIYLGVAVTAGQGFEAMGVYVMGGAFGQSPQYVGPLASLITPVEPGPGPGPASNGCHDMLLASEDTPGNRMVVVRRIQPGNGQVVMQTLDLQVRGPRSFDGHDAVESLQRMVDAAYPEGVPDGTPGLTDYLVYQRKTGAAEITYYGSAFGPSTTSQSAGGFSASTTSSGYNAYRPPLVRPEYWLAPGASATMASTLFEHSETTTTVTGQAPKTTVSDTERPVTETVRFVRRERVTVPAGSFDACVFESRWAEEPGTVSTSWVADGQGFELKTEYVQGGYTARSQTMSIRFNGQPITH